MRAMRNYGRLVAAILLPLGAGTAALNLVADPYAASPVTGLARLEDRRLNATRAAKAERLCRGEFRIVAFGTSIVNQALDPRGPAFHGEPTFIAGLPGSNLVEMRRAFELALGRGTMNTAILAVDPVMASASRNYVGDFDQSRFNPGLRYAEYRLRQLLGGDPTLDSISVILPPEGEPRPRADGFRPRPVETTLAWDDFADTLRQYFHDEWNAYRYDPPRVKGIGEMIEGIRKRRGRAIVIIPPLHAAAMEGMRLAGIEDGFDRLRRDLADLGGGTTAVWDFSGWTGPRAEPVPLEGKGTMRWYSDPLHPSAALGAVVAARAMDREDLVPPEFREFGVRLDPATVEAHVAALRRDGEAWRRSHPEEAARIGRLFESTAAERARRSGLPAAPPR